MKADIVRALKFAHGTGPRPIPILSEVCAACGQRAQGNFSLHRDGFAIGPEVALCDGCGSGVSPSLQEIWWNIAQRRKAGNQ